jgi:hypothetical protein
LFLFISVLGKLSLPFIARQVVFGTQHLDTDGIVYTCMEMAALAFFLLQNYYFVFAGLVDFHRRYYMIKSVGALIDPLKEDVSKEFRIVPTINVVCRESLYAWLQLR